MTNPTAAPMSPAQIAYVTARALLDSAHAESARLAPMPGPDASDDAVEAWLDASEALRSTLGLDRLVEALTVAEDALLSWSFVVARREAGRSRAKLALVAQLETGVRQARHLQIRCKAIDLALRLAA